MFGCVIELMIAGSVKEHGATEKLMLSSKYRRIIFFNPLITNVSHHIETSQLTCIADQLTGFYAIVNIGR